MAAASRPQANVFGNRRTWPPRAFGAEALSWAARSSRTRAVHSTPRPVQSVGQTERDTGPMNPYRADKPGGADIYRWCMNTLDPNLARPCLVCLLAEGDDILLPIQRNGVGPVEHHRATVTRLEDDEPNRRIRMTVRIHSLDTTATNEVKPGDLLHRVIDGKRPPKPRLCTGDRPLEVGRSHNARPRRQR